jgi:UDP-glucose 4-epimerase
VSDAMEGAEAVIHLAGIPYDIPPLHQVFEVNLQGTYNALEQAVDHGVKHFLYMSSIMAYGFGRNAAPQYLPVDEAHPALTYDTYGVSKLLGESLCKAFSEKHSLRTLCFRLTHFTAFSRPYPDVFPYRENEGAEALHQYIESRDLVALLEAALSATQITHDIFTAAAPDSGHVHPTPAVISKYYPEAELRYENLQDDSALVSMEKSRRLLGFVPRHSWRCSQLVRG